jgi:putative spermidine/putrescine transport system substrate-binding protein
MVILRTLAVTAGLVAGASIGAASARDLTVVSFGGSLQDAVRNAFITPFTKDTNIPVKEDTYDGSLSKISSQVQAKSVLWDVVDVESDVLAQGCQEGFLEKLDIAKIGNKRDYMSAAVNEPTCGIGYLAGAMTLTYDGAKLPDGPKTWADFWDVKKFPGKRGMRFDPKWTLELALLADGVPVKDVYHALEAPGGIDRAFKKLDELKPYIAWWKLGAESIQLLASGEVSMVAAYNGRVVAANRGEGRKFKMAWDAGAIYFMDYLALVKGSPKESEALQFIKFAMSPGPQAAFPTYVGYAPTNLLAFDKIANDIKADLPSEQNLRDAVVRNDQFWLDHGEELKQRFNVWAAQ